MTTRRRLLTIGGLVLASALATACATRSGAQAPRLAADLQRLENQLELLPPSPLPEAESGSLWTDAGPGSAMVRDTRAFRVNDMVTIVLDESSAGSNESTTDLKRSTDMRYSAPNIFGLSELDSVLDVDSDSAFSGEGKTARKSLLVGSITARVFRVLPNGDLIVSGQKTVMVNREKQILTLVGSVRPVDVTRGNRVLSTSVGNLTVRMWGSGEINDTVRQGWFMRVVNKIWPF